MGSFFRGDFGQYFTPRPIVKFIVDVLPIKNDSLVLDTSCGSGGFLLHALDKVRRQAKDYYNENTTDHYKFWHDFAEKNLYGIEINGQIARTAKMNMIIGCLILENTVLINDITSIWLALFKNEVKLPP